MSLNCMNCHVLQRIDSDSDINAKFIEKSEKHNIEDIMVNPVLRCKILANNRSWSGNLIPPSYNKPLESFECGSPTKKAKKAHRRYGSTGATCKDQSDDLSCEPKLVRSGGIRRDWSFEDLDGIKRDGKRKLRA